MTRNTGLSLLELLLAIALLSIILAAGATSLGGIIEQRRGGEVMRLLRGAIEFTRGTAISSGGLATLCPSRDGQNCGGRWHEGMIAFPDANGDRIPDPGDALPRAFRFPAPAGSLRWRSFGNRQYLQMTAMGFTRNQNGNFTWCPANGEPRQARQLIVNAAGRLREAEDGDGDGIREGGNGEALPCD